MLDFGSYQNISITNNATVNILIHISFGVLFSYLLG